MSNELHQAQQGADEAQRIKDEMLASTIATMLEARDDATIGRFQKIMEDLSKPVATPGQDVADKIANRASESVEVARWQPTDPLYADLARQWPAMAPYRTPDLDHWGAQWLRGKAAANHALMAMADAKMCEVFGRGMRANIVEGVFDTDDTSILTGTGGSLLPQPMQAVAMIARQAAAVLAPLLSNFTTTGATLRVPTSGAVIADTVAEGSIVPDAPPPFTSEMMILHKLGASAIVTIEMLNDSAFNLMQILSQSAGEGIGAAEDLQILTTDGVSPNLTEALVGGNVAEATMMVLVYADLVTLFFALGKPYQPRSTWLAGTTVMALISNLADSTGQPILKGTNMPNVISDVPNAFGTIFGRPIFHVPLPNNILLLGDLRSQAFLRKGGIEAAMSTDAGFTDDTVHFKFTERVDTRIIDDVGMKQIDLNT